ncbi:hypothetical protein G6F61_014259 [Rhizopus arrhizus]|nr:hypothetical protein G6F32_015599 [Rhizopus arrhizus]KAG1361619.1 hypothetical protein G6F61_014259 [Rhizopus arrhizus]
MTFGPGKQMSKTRERSRPRRRRFRRTSARESLRLRFKYKYSNPRGAEGSTGWNVRLAASFRFLVGTETLETGLTGLSTVVEEEATLESVTVDNLVEADFNWAWRLAISVFNVAFSLRNVDNSFKMSS